MRMQNSKTSASEEVIFDTRIPFPTVQLIHCGDNRCVNPPEQRDGFPDVISMIKGLTTNMNSECDAHTQRLLNIMSDYNRKYKTIKNTVHVQGIGEVKIALTRCLVRSWIAKKQQCAPEYVTCGANGLVQVGDIRIPLVTYVPNAQRTKSIMIIAILRYQLSQITEEVFEEEMIKIEDIESTIKDLQERIASA